MTSIRLAPQVIAILLSIVMGIVSVEPAEGQPNGIFPGEVGLEALTRGAVHEGFARPIAFDPAPGEVVSVQPPTPVDEQLPDYRLRGKNVGWMPGYWSWDGHREEYVWTSGFWRVWPRNRDYVPGYWEPVDGSWRKVAGFWTRAGTRNIRYYPTPPKSQEVGPSGPPPSADHIWLPGCYVWKEASFHWHKGFWAKAQLNWIWNPPHHVSTPAGAVYVDGYWDYTADRRGLLFAPASIPADVREFSNLQFRPRVVIDAEQLLNHLFCRVPGCYYLFGSYYAPSDYASGIYPWFVFHLTHGYDPLHAYYHWLRGRQDPSWQAQLAGSYRYRSDHEEARPTETFFEQHARFERQPSATMEQLALGRSLQDLAAAGDASLDLVPKSGPRPDVDMPSQRRPAPIVLASDRAKAETRLARLRADPAYAGAVLVWELPVSTQALQATPPTAPAASLPLQVQPQTQTRFSMPETKPPRAARDRRLPMFRRDSRPPMESIPSLRRRFDRQPVKPNKPRRIVPQVPQKPPIKKGGRLPSPNLPKARKRVG